MLDWISVLSLVGIGLVLLLIELFFVPGTTVVGVVGFVLAVFGIYLGFSYFGSVQGGLVMGGTLAIGTVLSYFGFKSTAWHKFALNKQLTGRVNDEAEAALQVGSEGKAISALRPAGNADFNGQIFEVHSLGQLLQVGTPIRVIKIENYKVLVEPAF